MACMVFFLHRTFLTRALQTWEEARQADADNSDERVVSAVVSSLCVSMSSTNTSKDIEVPTCNMYYCSWCGE